MAPVASVDYRVQQRADIEGGCHPEHDDRACASLLYSAPEPGYVHGVGPQSVADPLLHLGERRFSKGSGVYLIQPVPGQYHCEP